MENGKTDLTKKDKRYIVVSAGLLAAAGILQMAARMTDGFGQWYAATVYPLIAAVYSSVFGVFFFSVAEIGIYLLVLAFLFYGLRRYRKGKWILSRALFIISLLAFLYTANCGVNYYRRPFSNYLNMEVRSSSVKELEELCQYLTVKVNEFVDETPYKNEWRKEARIAMKKLGETYPELGGYYPMPKPVLVSNILSVQHLSGIYSPFTVEANFNRDMTAYNIPYTMCHELSHLKGFMREDEANFIGYLACIQSDNRSFQYSGYLMGWIHAANALSAQDAEGYMELYRKLDVAVLKHLSENSAFWERFEGRVAEVSNKLNDSYLKFNSQQDGVRSYGRTVDLMLAYYREEIRFSEQDF